MHIGKGKPCEPKKANLHAIRCPLASCAHAGSREDGFDMMLRHSVVLPGHRLHTQAWLGYLLFVMGSAWARVRHTHIVFCLISHVLLRDETRRHAAMSACVAVLVQSNARFLFPRIGTTCHAWFCVVASSNKMRVACLSRNSVTCHDGAISIVALLHDPNDMDACCSRALPILEMPTCAFALLLHLIHTYIYYIYYIRNADVR